MEYIQDAPKEFLLFNGNIDDGLLPGLKKSAADRFAEMNQSDKDRVMKINVLCTKEERKGHFDLYREVLRMVQYICKEERIRSAGGKIDTSQAPVKPELKLVLGEEDYDMPKIECTVCKAVECKVCQGCRLVYYCGPYCQKTDWQRHKPTCLKLRIRKY